MKKLEILLLLFLLSSSFVYGIKRKLVDDDEDSDSIDSSVDEDSDLTDMSTETEETDVDTSTDNWNTTRTDINDPNPPPNYQHPLLILVGYGFFHRMYPYYPHLVFFRVYFKRIRGYPIISRFLIFHVVVYYWGRLRTLEGEGEGETIQTNCTRVTSDYNDDIQYDCTFPVDPNRNFTTVVSKDDFQFIGIDTDLIISSEANFTMRNISNQTGSDYEQGVMILNNTQLEENGMKFTLIGNLSNDITDREVTLFFDENGDGNLKNATCSVTNLGQKIYQLDCTTQEFINAELNGVTGIIVPSNKKLFVYMGEDENHILNSGINHQSLYKRGQSSGGLSGGAIAAIVIACVVAMVSVAIIAMICKGKRESDLPQESTLGINTNNLSQ